MGSARLGGPKLYHHNRYGVGLHLAAFNRLMNVRRPLKHHYSQQCRQENRCPENKPNGHQNIALQSAYDFADKFQQHRPSLHSKGSQSQMLL